MDLNYFREKFKLGGSTRDFHDSHYKDILKTLEESVLPVNLFYNLTTEGIKKMVEGNQNTLARRWYNVFKEIIEYEEDKLKE